MWAQAEVMGLFIFQIGSFLFFAFSSSVPCLLIMQNFLVEDSSLNNGSVWVSAQTLSISYFRITFCGISLSSSLSSPSVNLIKLFLFWPYFKLFLNLLTGFSLDYGPCAITNFYFAYIESYLGWSFSYKNYLKDLRLLRFCLPISPPIAFFLQFKNSA